MSSGLKNPGSTRIERGIDAGYSKKREIGTREISVHSHDKISINFVEDELARRNKCVDER